MVSACVGAMLTAIFFLFPAEISPPIGAVAVLVWQSVKVGGVLRCRVARVPLIPVVAIAAIPSVMLSWAMHRNKPGRPRIVEVLTDFNNGTVELSSSLVIVSSCVPGGRFDAGVISASLENKRRYCNLKKAMRSSHVRCMLFDSQTQGQHHAKWEKYIHFRKEMATSRDEWFMWIDCDAVFTNASFDWSAVLPPLKVSSARRPSRDMVLSRDRNGFNLGVFLLRNTPWSLGFIDAMLAMQTQIDQTNHPNGLRDQKALGELLRVDPLLIRRLHVVPQRLMNSYFSHSKGNGELWEEGDWIAHQVDCIRQECNSELMQLAGLHV